MEPSMVLNVELVVEETSDRTDAKASLTLRDVRFAGWGRARRSPGDPNVPMIGEELAVSRALADLSHQMLEAATTRIEEYEGRPVHVRQ